MDGTLIFMMIMIKNDFKILTNHKNLRSITH
jgi:hypothetical protein